MNCFIRTVLVVTFATANIFNISAQENSENLHNFANYNIRYTNNAEDTGERLWSERGSYVMQLIKDYDFDIVGMEEVTGRTGKYSINAATNTSQLEDLKAGLTEYTLLTYERDGNVAAKDYSYNVIAYKTDKYECLDEGCFWISPTPDIPSVGWDPDYTIKRTCAWTKMKVKSTGEIFYFAVTHCNYGPSLDGPNGGHLVANRLSQIAGQLPVILVGDFNMNRDEHKEAYREYTALFSDAALTAEKVACMPKENGSTTITAHNWYPVTSSQFSGNEFDFGFYRNMQVAERYIITENYGRSVSPSDHFPILMRCRLTHKKAIYVDGSAASGGDGSILAPYNSINSAMKFAVGGDTVCVATGVYREAVNLTSPAVIIGGYDSQFQEIVGKSILDGDVNGDDALGVTSDNLYNLMVAIYTGLDLRNFVLRNAVSVNRASDGALAAGGAELRLNNVNVENNSANITGAGLIAQCRSIDLNRCSFRGNMAAEYGAGSVIFATDEVNVSNCIFDSNSAKAGAALYIVDATELKLWNNAFYNNESKQYGTFFFPTNTNDKQYGPFIFKSSANAYNIALWNNTFANNKLTSPTGLSIVTKKFGGAAIYAQFADAATLFNMAHNTIVGNTATFAGSNKANYGGSAVNIYGGKVTLMNNIIAGNYSEGAYSDLYVDVTSTVAKEQYNMISAATTASKTLSEKDFTAESYDAALTAFLTTLDGTVIDGKFVANIADNGGVTPTVKVISKEYAGINIAVLTQFLRYIETSFNLDIDGNGSIGGTLKTDQRGEERSLSSVPGACEYICPSAVESVENVVSMVKIIAIDNNKYQLTRIDGAAVGVVNVYDANGRILLNVNAYENQTVLNLSHLSSGLYIISLANACYKVIVKN